MAILCCAAKNSLRGTTLAGMLTKTVRLATAWREANSDRDNRNITESTAKGETHNSKDARNSRD